MKVPIGAVMVLGFALASCGPKATYPSLYVGRWQNSDEPMHGAIFKPDGSGNVTFHPMASDGMPFSWRVTKEGFLDVVFYGEEGEHGDYVQLPVTLSSDQIEFKEDPTYFKCRYLKKLTANANSSGLSEAALLKAAPYLPYDSPFTMKRERAGNYDVIRIEPETDIRWSVEITLDAKLTLSSIGRTPAKPGDGKQISAHEAFGKCLKEMALLDRMWFPCTVKVVSKPRQWMLFFGWNRQPGDDRTYYVDKTTGKMDVFGGM